MKKRLALLLSLLICFFIAGCGPALLVNSEGDQPDIDLTDGVCKTANNKCTLRAAIMEANVSDDISKITFNNSVQIISPSTNLPALSSGNTHIYGEGNIILDGSQISESSSTYGLQIINSNRNIIQGLKIRRFDTAIHILADQGKEAKYNTIGLLQNETGDTTQRNIIILNLTGISIKGEGAFYNEISGNHIGMNNDGVAPRPNEHYGINISQNSHDNLIGSLTGNSPLEGGNLISGNGWDGITIRDGSNSNRVSGNIIGTDLAGETPIPNANGLKLMTGSTNNIIGISPSGEGLGNLISGNTGAGIKLELSNLTTIAGNLIGTDRTGTISIPNDDGILIYDSDHSVIGTNGDGNADELEANLISGNNDYGVYMYPAESNHNIIAGNKIGTDITGANSLGNGLSGSQKDGLNIRGNFTRIGTNGDGVSDDIEGNLISGNGGYGINSDSNGNRISGNIIGLDITGAIILGNQSGGLQLSSQNLVGTEGSGVSDDLERNIISGNGVPGEDNYGIKISGNGNTIAGNYIGTDITGSIPLGSDQHGIYITGNDNIVGTNGDGSADEFEGNLISGNNGYPLQILEGNNNVVSGNLIGTDLNGTTALPNGAGSPTPDYGALRISGNNNVIGTNGNGTGDHLEGNLISGNLTGGVELWGENNVIAGNKIGTDISGTAALGNAGPGFDTWGYSVNNRIGTNGDGLSDLEEGNIIGANGGDGIKVQAPNCQIAGNFIGTDPSGTIDLGNAMHGIHLREDASEITIGGSVEKSNAIAFNGGNGINFQSNINNKALITYNSIHSNQDLGIDLSPNGGVTTNDPGDLDTGANDLMNYPVLSSASSVTGFVAINGEMISSLPNTSYLVQFFDNENCDSPSGHGEGKTYIGSSQVWADINGNGPFSTSFIADVPAGHYITATATAYGKTSEFSACVEVTGGESTYSEEDDPCDQFNQELMTLTTFNVRPETNLFYLYVKNVEPFPGSGPDQDGWKYYANLGDISAYKCSFDGPEDRIYCYFSIPENYINTIQSLKMFSNICIPPFYLNDEVSIFSQNPSGSSGSPDNPPGSKPEGCHSGLDQRTCISLGGIYNAESKTCFCPRSAD